LSGGSPDSSLIPARIYPRFCSLNLKEKNKMSNMKLYVGNLSFSTTDSSLNDLFSQAGTVESARIVTDRDSGQSRGFGFVEMASRSEGEAAISQLNGKEVDGRALKVNEAKPQENRGGGGNRGGYGNRGGGGGGNRFGKRY
jgi:RNA recognition motif-containing protein